MLIVRAQDYIRHIQVLNDELVAAWHNQERVKALKIVIQTAKCLAGACAGLDARSRACALIARAWRRHDRAAVLPEHVCVRHEDPRYVAELCSTLAARRPDARALARGADTFGQLVWDRLLSKAQCVDATGRATRKLPRTRFAERLLLHARARAR